MIRDGGNYISVSSDEHAVSLIDELPGEGDQLPMAAHMCDLQSCLHFLSFKAESPASADLRQ